MCVEHGALPSSELSAQRRVDNVPTRRRWCTPTHCAGGWVGRRGRWSDCWLPVAAWHRHSGQRRRPRAPEGCLPEPPTCCGSCCCPQRLPLHPRLQAPIAVVTGYPRHLCSALPTAGVHHQHLWRRRCHVVCVCPALRITAWPVPLHLLVIGGNQHSNAYTSSTGTLVPRAWKGYRLLPSSATRNVRSAV